VAAALKSNRCPTCGGQVEMHEERHSLTVYQLLPDGTVGVLGERA